MLRVIANTTISLIFFECKKKKIALEFLEIFPCFAAMRIFPRNYMHDDVDHAWFDFNLQTKILSLYVDDT